MKIIRLLVFLIIIAGIVFYFAFDGIAKNIFQNKVQESLHTAVSVADFKSDVFAKTINISQVKIKNLANFKNQDLLVIDKFNITISDQTTTDLIVIDSMKLDGIHAVFEQNNTGFNFKKLLDKLEATPANSNTTNTDSKNNGMRLIINNLIISNSTLKIDSKLLQKTIKIPSISSANFGGKNGILVADISKQLVKKILNNLQKALKKQSIDSYKDKIKQNLIKKLMIN